LPNPQFLAAIHDADIAILEAVTSLPALEAAVERVRNRWTKPIMATLSFGRDGTLSGRTPQEVARAAQALGLAAFGYGCGFGLEHARRIVQALREAAPEAVLIAKPNVGVPPVARSTPEEAAGWAEGMAALGVQVVGTCCGSAPAHTRAIADRLEAQRSEAQEDESDGN
jgi:5-methyltetrahydrofolate--homocysteine methyltransferase